MAKSKNVDQSLALTLKSDQLVSLMKRPISIVRAGVKITLQVKDFTVDDEDNVRRIARLCKDYLDDLEDADEDEDEDSFDEDDDEDDMEYEEDDEDEVEGEDEEEEEEEEEEE